MAFQVVSATITGRTASGTGFDLILKPVHTRAIGFTLVQCDEIGAGVERLVVPLEALLHEGFLDQLLELLGEDCPQLYEWVERVRAIIRRVKSSKAFVDLRINPDVEGHCGEELCYWDDDLKVVVCFE